MQNRAVENLAIGSSQDFPPVIAAIPITKRQTRIALGVIIFILSAVVIVAPFASVRLFRVDAFLPVLQAVMCVVDIITLFICPVFDPPDVCASGSRKRIRL